MRCRRVTRMLDEFEGAAIPAAVGEHVAGCASCCAYRERLRVLRQGFRALAEETVPEASIGFVQRVMRGLEDMGIAADPAREFLERAGRRVVYAGLLLAMMIMLALVVPSWRALRSSSTTEVTPAPQLQAESDPVFADDSALRLVPINTHVPAPGER